MAATRHKETRRRNHADTVRLLVVSWCLFVRFGGDSPALSAGPPEPVYLAGDFNGWESAAPDWRMRGEGGRRYALERFWKRGQHRFKFAPQGELALGWGVASDGRVYQPGRDISLTVEHHGDYRLELDLDRRQWRFRPVTNAVPRAVLLVAGRAEAGLPLTLD
ncbi:hypothetical protein HQ590_11480, partial [bacterium]|nr:hypothetical protein [bacterium]